jgi:hypothetical protein
MLSIHVRNVAEALPIGLMHLKERGVRLASRGGPTVEYPGPVATTYDRPWERVLLDPTRDCNPFFHFMEGLWMLAGARDVASLAAFNSRMPEYSDDGVVFNGAYGYRAREHFGIDQLMAVVSLLREDPSTRRAVVCLWDPKTDLKQSKDIPCNDLIVFRATGGILRMTVYNRSNDVIWGAYGANAVHFSMIHEWVCAMVGMEQGSYTQVSNSFHAYTELPLWQQYEKGIWKPYEHVANPYAGPYKSEPFLFADPLDAINATDEARGIFNIVRETGRLAPAFTGAFGASLRTHVMRAFAVPMLVAWSCHKAGDQDGALRACDKIYGDDWREACTSWLLRRYSKVSA